MDLDQINLRSFSTVGQRARAARAFAQARRSDAQAQSKRTTTARPEPHAPALRSSGTRARSSFSTSSNARGISTPHPCAYCTPSSCNRSMIRSFSAYSGLEIHAQRAGDGANQSRCPSSRSERDARPLDAHFLSGHDCFGRTGRAVCHRRIRARGSARASPQRSSSSPTPVSFENPPRSPWVRAPASRSTSKSQLIRC